MKEFNKYQLQQELKKELHNRKQDGKFFYYEDFITIEYSSQFDWLCVEWRGYQTEQSLKEGFEKMLEALAVFHCKKILNDNTNVVGIWAPASAWLAVNWIPRIKKAGVEFFALVYSPNISRRLADESIRNAPQYDIDQTFEDIESAKSWLNCK